MTNINRIVGACVVGATLALAAGCGSEKDKAEGTPSPSASDLRAQLAQATRPRPEIVPAVDGRTLQEVADGIGRIGPEVGLATSVFTPGTSRLAFGVIDKKSGFVYGPTAVYLASDGDELARGPYPAPADLLITDAPYRSQQAATEKDPFAAIYEANVPLRKPGNQAVLVVTSVNGELVAAVTQIKVVDADSVPVPAVGDRAPRAQTDTLASLGGDRALLETRVPADGMHDVDLASVIGRKPVALVFATPQLCESRVCGPVVDIALQLKARYGDRISFIHQEVYVDNDPQKGVRKPLEQFGLPTEPWLFVLDQQGRIAARLEGSFGFAAFERALRSVT